MTWDEFITPQPPPPPEQRRKPWDQVIEEFAKKHGRPVWAVTRVTPSDNGRVAGHAAFEARKVA